MKNSHLSFSFLVVEEPREFERGVGVSADLLPRPAHFCDHN